MNVSEELLDLQSLKDLTRGRDLFLSVCSAVNDMKIPWNEVTGITTDGAPAMAGERSGLSTLVCNKVSEEGGKAIKLHWIIHQQVLCAKHLKYDHLFLFNPCIICSFVFQLTTNRVLQTPQITY